MSIANLGDWENIDNSLNNLDASMNVAFNRLDILDISMNLLENGTEYTQDVVFNLRGTLSTPIINGLHLIKTGRMVIGVLNTVSASTICGNAGIPNQWNTNISLPLAFQPDVNFSVSGLEQVIGNGNLLVNGVLPNLADQINKGCYCAWNHTAKNIYIQQADGSNMVPLLASDAPNTINFFPTSSYQLGNTISLCWTTA